MKSITAPSPTSYLDLHQYLKDVYNHRKNLDNTFSYQTWAEELGLKSRSSLRLVILGQKPLTLSLSQTLAAALNLSALEREYFLLMTAHHLETEPEKRKARMRHMLDLLKYINGRVECSDLDDFLADTHIPPLQVLLSFEDLSRTPESISRLLQKDLSLIETWLQTLQNLKLAHFNPETQSWEALHNSFKISERLGNNTLQNYHAAVLRESAEAIHLPVHTRRFRTLLMALNESQYTEFCQKLDESLSSLLSQYASSEFQGKKLYRYTMALTPLSSVSSEEHENEKLPRNEATV